MTDNGLFAVRFPTSIAVELDLRTELDDLAASQRPRISRSRMAEMLLREALAAREQPSRDEPANAP